MIDVAAIRSRFATLLPFLDERARRLVAASEAKAAGYGGIAAASVATGVARSTIGRGLAELTKRHDDQASRVRRPGAGRKPATMKQPALLAALQDLVTSAIRGDPEAALLWVSRSQRHLAEALSERGFKSYLMAIAVFCNEVKGKSMLAFSRDLDVQYKTAFVLAHKLREAMASSMKALRIGGEGRTAEIDGAYFGGHIRPENLAADRIDRRLAEHQSGKRRVVVAMRERGGRTLAQVFPAEADSVAAIRLRIAKGTVIHADESPAWNVLHAGFAMKRINHQDGYRIDDVCTNGAESYFSRLRRGELGHHHHIAGPYLVRYAQEAAWREDLRRVSNGDQVYGVVGLAMHCKPSVDFCGYWQRARAA